MSEWIAEFMMKYLRDPQATKIAAPNATLIIRELWNGNDAVNSVLTLS